MYVNVDFQSVFGVSPVISGKYCAELIIRKWILEWNYSSWRVTPLERALEVTKQHFAPILYKDHNV